MTFSIEHSSQPQSVIPITKSCLQITDFFKCLLLFTVFGFLFVYTWREPILKNSNQMKPFYYRPPYLDMRNIHKNISPVGGAAREDNKDWRTLPKDHSLVEGAAWDHHKGVTSVVTNDTEEWRGPKDRYTNTNITTQIVEETAEQMKGFFGHPTCQPLHNVVLIKNHKCASSTIANIFTRYGLKYHLNFALPRYEIGHIGWPKSLLPKHIEPIGKNRQINIITHHITYNETTLTNLMPKDTKYFAILREPFSQFKSTMFYFGLECKQYHFKTKDVVTEFLSNPQFFERKTAFYSNGFLLGHRSMTLNFMSTEFGFDNDIRNDTNKVHEFMAYIKMKFDLVLIREYLTESVVLMRRLLCWPLEDVIHLAVNKRSSAQKSVSKDYDEAKETDLRRKYEAWSRVDFMMYDFFNKTLWEKIAAQGPDFWSELKVCNMVNELVTTYCADKQRKPVLVVPETLWNKKFEFKAGGCKRMSEGPHRFNREMGMQMGLPRFRYSNPYARNLLPPGKP